MVEKMCIICMEICEEKYCKCKANFHKKCYEEWMRSEYNMNKGKCPHCKEELIIKEKKYKKCCECKCRCNCFSNIVVSCYWIYIKLINIYNNFKNIIKNICMPWLPITDNYNYLEIIIVMAFRMSIAFALIFILSFIIPALIGSLIVVLYYSITDKDNKDLNFKKQLGIFLLLGYGYAIFSSCCICLIKNIENRNNRNQLP